MIILLIVILLLLLQLMNISFWEFKQEEKQISLKKKICYDASLFSKFYEEVKSESEPESEQVSFVIEITSSLIKKIVMTPIIKKNYNDIKKGNSIEITDSTMFTETDMLKKHLQHFNPQNGKKRYELHISLLLQNEGINIKQNIEIKYVNGQWKSFFARNTTKLLYIGIYNNCNKITTCEISRIKISNWSPKK